MQSTSAFVDSLRPKGSKRSGKRDFIVNVFLRQDGHISADDLVDLITREDRRISRATVYRTLQWMVEAGIARKVDFGEGRYRFEHSYRHPRHFHLICKSCNRSSEFLSSDIESLIEEVAAARRFAPRQSVVQIYGTCEECRTGRASPATETATELLFARDALRIAIATERSGRDFYAPCGEGSTRDARARAVFLKLSTEEVDHLHRLERALSRAGRPGPRARVASDVPLLQGRRQRVVRGRRRRADAHCAATGKRCSSASAASAARIASSRSTASASRIPRASRIFLEFADEERDHLELLIREYRALVRREPRSSPVAPRPDGPRRANA